MDSPSFCTFFSVCILSLGSCTTSLGRLSNPIILDSMDYHIHTLAIPNNIYDPQEQAAYLVEHYWNGIVLSDSLGSRKKEYLEQAIVDYIGLLQSLPKKHYGARILTPLELSSGNTLLSILSIYRSYLYEPNSPLTSDYYYRLILEWAIQTPKISTSYQIQAKELYARLNMNAVGESASNFIYTKLDGGKLHLLNQTYPQTLVLFGTPGCPSCHSVIESFSNNIELQHRIKQGEIGILFIYIQCSLEEFTAEASNLPQWIESGYDESGEILNKPLYDIKASPTIYLINRAGKVIGKDLTLDRLNELILST